MHVASDVDRPLALTATGLTAQTVAALALATAWPGGSRARDARVVVAVGGAVSLVVASLYAGGAAYAEAGSLVVGTALLLVLAAVLAVAGTVLADRAAYAAAVPVLDGGAAVLLVTAAWAPAYDLVPDRWLPAVLAALGLALLAASLLVPRVRRHGHRGGGARCRAAAGAGGRSSRWRTRSRTCSAERWSGRGSSPRPTSPVIGRRPGCGRAAGRRPGAGGGRAGPCGSGCSPPPPSRCSPPQPMLTPPALGAGFPLTLGVAVAIAAALLVAGALLDSRGRLVAGLGSARVRRDPAGRWPHRGPSPRTERRC